MPADVFYIPRPHRVQFDATRARRRQSELAAAIEETRRRAAPWREKLDAERQIEQESLARQRPLRAKVQEIEKDLYAMEEEHSLICRMFGGKSLIADSAMGPAIEDPLPEIVETPPGSET